MNLRITKECKEYLRELKPIRADEAERAEVENAVPVVRCKECKHRGSAYNCPMRHLVMPDSGPGSFADCTEDEGYCHKGVRADVGTSD